MKKAKNSPTKEQEEFFWSRIAHYQKKLNLLDWRIEPSGKPASKGAMADVGISLEDRLAVVSLGNDWAAMPINERTLNETACHEVLHIYLTPFKIACFSRDESHIDALEHSLIVVLEKLLA